MLQRYDSNEGLIHLIEGGVVTHCDVLPWDAPPETGGATQLSRDEFITAFVLGLSQQLLALGETLHTVPNDRVLVIVSRFAKDIADDIGNLNEGAEADRRRTEIDGEIARARRDENEGLVEELQAERAGLPHVQYQHPEHFRPILVQASEEEGMMMMASFVEPPVMQLTATEAPKLGFLAKLFGRS